MRFFAAFSMTITSERLQKEASAETKTQDLTLWLAPHGGEV
jgi:hypothetical protein